jgi:hypothetical protein
VLDPVRSVLRADVRESGRVLHLHVDDRNICSARGLEHRPRRLGRCCDPADVDARVLEHPARRAEVVLHVHHEDSCALRVDL